MSKHYAELLFSDGRKNRYRLEAPELILGRSTKAGIALPGETGLELEHLLLSARGAHGCWISVAEHASSAELNGAAFRSGLVPWGTEIRVAGLSVRLCEPEQPAGFGQRRALYLGALALVVAASWLLMSDGSVSPVDAEASRGHPRLFAEQTRCPNPEAALSEAQELERRATSHFVRYGYDPADGVKAVRRFEEAAACYASAGRRGEAAQARGTASKLRPRIEADYAAVRLRLEDAIERARWPEIARAASHLRRLTAHLRGNEYVQWLESIETQASAKL